MTRFLFVALIVVLSVPAFGVAEADPGAADLQIADALVTVPDPAQPNRVSVELSVANRGDAPAGAFVIRWYPHQASNEVGCSTDVPGLDAGKKGKSRCHYTYIGNGQMHWRAVVDEEAEIAESNERNNTQSGMVTIGGPSASPATAYEPAFGIDYAHPQQYLAQGEQSQISDPTVLNSLRAEEQSLAHLGDIYRWLKDEFTAYSAGGETIGVVTVDELLTERRLGGCHDHGLVYAAVARELGYPAVMARTCSIAWVEGFQAGEKGPHVGHVFVEVYLNGKWVLIDSTNGWYVGDGYDPANPVIPLRQRVADPDEELYGFHVERKGTDTWAFGIHSQAESRQAMDDLARQLDLGTITYPEYAFQRFAR